MDQAADKQSHMPVVLLVWCCRVNPEDELFVDPDAELDLLGGMDLPQPPVSATSDKSRDQASNLQHKEVSDGSLEAAQHGQLPTSGHHRERPSISADGDNMSKQFDDRLFEMDDIDHLGDLQRSPDHHGSDQQQARDQSGEGAVLC